MFVSAREAAGILGEVRLSREQARRLLQAGFAGPAVRTRGALLYDAERVHALTRREVADGTGTLASSPLGVFIARVGPRRGLDVQAAPPRQRDAIKGAWDISLWRRIWLQHAIEVQGFVPVVATVSGFVAVGADLVGLVREKDRGTPPGRHDTGLLLEEPGAWFEAFAGKRFPTGPGGPWQLWLRRP